MNQAGSPTSSLRLQDGSRVAVIGGGPAGSFFSLFLLGMAERIGLSIDLDVYESRDFSRPGPGGCNMCGGIISETLVQNLAVEGINLPPTVVQRGIDSYVLHTETGKVRIATPLEEKRIAAVHRGAGPRGLKETTWESFDGYLQSLSGKAGARIVPGRVEEICWEEDKPRIRTRESAPEPYDLLAVAVGVNSSALKLVEGLGTGYRPPGMARTFICEYLVGKDVIAASLGNSMHVFLVNVPRLEFAALIPKGEYVTLCMLGRGIDQAMIDGFLALPAVKGCFPPGMPLDQPACHCAPKINVAPAHRPFADRLVVVGDSGTARLYKDGIGSAYRTAKAAASAAVFHGISAEDFRRHYMPACRVIDHDNRIGGAIFAMMRQMQRFGLVRRALLRMTATEQDPSNRRARRMSAVMWDMFTGSSPYKEILVSTLHPAFPAALAWNVVCSSRRPREGGSTT